MRAVLVNAVAFDAKWEEESSEYDVFEDVDFTNSKGETEKCTLFKNEDENYFHDGDVQAFIKALRSVFPDACKGDVTEWNFSAINTKETARIKLLSLMRDYKELDSTLFAKWDLSGDDLSARPLQVKLAAQIQSLRNSVKKLNENKDNEKGDAIE